MSPTTFFVFLGSLLVLAFVANRLYRITRIPDVIVLMAVGLILGPGTGWVKSAQFQPITHILGTLALILVLFEGGLELNLSDTLRHFPGGVLLAIAGYAFSMGAVGLAAWKLHYFALRPALMIGAVLGCVSSTIVLPVLQQIRVSQPVRLTLLVESSLSDVLGVLTVSVLLVLAPGVALHWAGFVAGVLTKLVACIAGAVGAGLLWSRLLPRLSEERFWQVLTFSVVLLIYAGTQAASHGGLIAVLAFGLTLANARRPERSLFEAALGVHGSGTDQHLEILSFHSELAFLVRSFFFILLGVIVQLSGLRGYAMLTIITFIALIVARWFAVKLTAFTWGEKDRAERSVALWIFPRGLITAVLAIQVIDARGAEFAFLPALAFAIILVTNVMIVIESLRRGPAVPAAEPLVTAGKSTQG